MFYKDGKKIGQLSPYEQGEIRQMMAINTVKAQMFISIKYKNERVVAGITPLNMLNKFWRITFYGGSYVDVSTDEIKDLDWMC